MGKNGNEVFTAFLYDEPSDFIAVYRPKLFETQHFLEKRMK